MAKPFATHDEIADYLGHDQLYPLAEKSKPAVIKVVEVASDALREEAKKVGKNLDEMFAADESYANLVKSVVADIAMRYLATDSTAAPMTQVTQAAGGYSVSGTYLVPGGGLYIKKSELARLGLRRQKVGGVDFYGLSD